MIKLYCAVCGDDVKVIYPCKFVFHDGIFVDIDICLGCMNNGTLTIDLNRKRLVGKILNKLDKRNGVQ